jgi:glyoxylase-like metal-dependent hydrolase (beta-lactamase superfamily II)
VSEVSAHWTIGDALIWRVDEVILEGHGRWLFPDLTAELVAEQRWLDPSATDDRGDIRLSVHSFVLDVTGMRIVIDTGVGNGKVRANPAWNNLGTDYLSRLVACGVDADTVDLVVNTHLHRDHVGWNTTLRDGEWVPTFPHARYLVTRTEWDYWSTAPLDDDQQRMFADSITPVREGGQLELVDAAAPVEIADGVELIPSPGHTPGHVSVLISSAGRAALVTGDFLHHPIQLAHPNLCCSADVDYATSERTRAAMLSRIADTETLLLGTHFTHPAAGHVRSTPSGYAFAPFTETD